MKLWAPVAAAILSAVPAGLLAQQIEGPVLGYVWDSGARSIRVVRGLPGAAVTGDAVRTSAPLMDARIAPSANYAVVLAEDSRYAGIVALDSGIVSKLPVRAGAGRFEISPSGSAAAFAFPEGVVEIVSGLPSHPTTKQFSLAPLRRALRRLHVTDDGTLLLANEGEAIVVLSDAGEVNRLETGTPLSAAQFLSGTHGIVMSTAGESWYVPDAAVGDRIHITHPGVRPTAIAAVDARRVVLADAASGRIAIVDLAAGGPAPALLDCDCTPDGLARMSLGSTYRLTNYSGTPMRLLDLSGDAPRVLSVPPQVTSTP